MSFAFQLYDRVRVSRLLVRDRHYIGTRGVSRGPRVGDLGVIFELLDPSNACAPLGVECVDRSGHSVWLAEFDPSELELVGRPA